MPMQPSSVLLTFDRQGEMVLPLAEPAVAGKPLRGRVELDSAPHAVTVKGAQRQLEAMKAQGYRVQTEPVDVDGPNMYTCIVGVQEYLPPPPKNTTTTPSGTATVNQPTAPGLQASAAVQKRQAEIAALKAQAASIAAAK